MTTDDEDTYHKQSNNSTPDNTSPNQFIKNKKTNQSYNVRFNICFFNL